jgi:peptidoglycan/xylan/chitin deacetylase (PgdA/CDA1 family)
MTPAPASPADRHVVSFCFDDGYAQSCRTAAQLFEARGVRAEFCVVTEGKGSADAFIRAGDIADFTLWRDLSARGHRVSPHGDRHIHLGMVPEDEARAEIETGLRRFCAEMGIVDTGQLIWHCAFNNLPETLRPWLRSRVRAARASTSNNGSNPHHWTPADFVFDSCFPLPPDIPGAAHARIDSFLAAPPAWLVLCFHGLGEEGWGPVDAGEVAGLVDRLTAAGATILPASAVIERANR